MGSAVRRVVGARRRPRVIATRPTITVPVGGRRSGTVAPAHPGFDDPNLRPATHFHLDIGRPMLRGPGGFYDADHHRYSQRFIDPSAYELRLDASIGLQLLRKSATAMAAAAPGNTGTGSGGGGGGKLIPDDLVAFTWTVFGKHSGFHRREIVQRPITPMEVAVFELPGRSDFYEVSLKVSFKNGAFSKRIVHVDVRDWLIVSLGDSSASGQGNPDQNGTVDHNKQGQRICDFPTLAQIAGVTPPMNNAAEWVERKAYRSLAGVPAQAARSLARTSGQTFIPGAADVARFSFDRITFASFARSGAEVLDGIIDPQGGDSDFIGAGQLEECRRTVKSRRIDALMINIGGNDAGFSVVLEDLVSKDSIYTGSLRGTIKAAALASIAGPPGDDKLARDQVAKRLSRLLGIGLPPGQKGELEVHYDMLRAAVQDLQRSPGVGQVYITGYPIGLFDVRQPDGAIGFKSCEIFDGPDIDLTMADGRMIKTHGRNLNALIARKAREFDWHFIDVEQEFEGHGYCSTQPFWRTAKQSCFAQGDFNGTMHPNTEGVRVWAAKYAKRMRDHTIATRGEDPMLRP